MMPESPLGKQYLMWFRVVYTSTPLSSQAALFTLIVSCTAASTLSLSEVFGKAK